MRVDDPPKFYDLSIPLRFDGPQPNSYGVPPATAAACEADGLVGDTRRGGSCNFEQYTLVAHCNGTHTECIGHITHERITIRDCLQDTLMLADLVSVVPELQDDGDLIVTGEALQTALVPDLVYAGEAADLPTALIIRTFPNDEGKLSRIYDATAMAPYLSPEAMQLIVEAAYRHLLVDLPSIDRLFDEGRMLNHRTFWNVEPGSFEAGPDSRMRSTITELIFVPDEVPDGRYLLNLQIAPFASDAAPSRPIIWSISA